MPHRSLAIALGLLVLLPAITRAQSEDMAPRMFQRFVQAQGRALRANDVAPGSRIEWGERRVKLRADLLAAWGGISGQAVSAGAAHTRRTETRGLSR